MVSIILVLYNSDYKKIRFSLDNILSQTYKDFEVIIADDCSVNDPIGFVDDYMRACDFKNYKLIRNSQNYGTVHNILGALNYATGEYVKTLGAGDGFYSHDSLEKMMKFSYDNQVEFGYAKTGMFYLNGEEVIIRPLAFPFAIYDFVSHRNSQRNCLLYKDNASGISMWFRTDLLIKYLNNAKASVKYEEDICQLEYLLDGHRIICCDECFFLYEGYAGVSAVGNDAFSQLLHKDENEYYKYLSKKYPENKWLRKREKLQRVIDIKNVRVRAICMMLLSPLEVRIFVQRYFALCISKKYGSTKECEYEGEITNMYESV